MELNWNYSKKMKIFDGLQLEKSKIIDNVKKLSPNLTTLEIFQKFFTNEVLEE